MRESPLQVHVRTTLAALGGYWRPAGAAIRLLEELGELAEHALDPLLPASALAGECADLWIITTALADQFYGFVEEPRPPLAPPVDGPQQLVELVAAGGRIGRIVNYYDGPKNPRSFDGWLTLEQAVAAFHGHLAAFAATNGVDLLAAIDAKLTVNGAQDAGRFAATHDPRTAPILERFAPILSAPGYPFPGEVRLFGAPEWISGETRASIEAFDVPFQTYLRAQAHERLDGFVFSCPGSWPEPGIVGQAMFDRAPHTALISQRFSPPGDQAGPSLETRETFTIVRVPTGREPRVGEAL